MSATAPRPHPAAWRSRADRRGRAAARTGRITWALTHRRMAGMDAGPGSDLGGLGWFAATWALMMAAMMLPAVAPMVAAYRSRTAGLGATPAFAAGYLITWLVTDLFGYALIEGVRLLDLGFLAWDEAGRYLAGSVILGGALYQLTARRMRACVAAATRGRSLTSTGARAAWAPFGWARSTAGSAW